MDAALSIVDLEKFYDTIRIDHLVNMALTLQARRAFCSSTLAPRAIQYLGAVSHWLKPGGQHCSGIPQFKQLGPHPPLRRSGTGTGTHPLGLPLPVGGRHQSPRVRHARGSSKSTLRHPRASNRPTEQRVTHLHQVPDCGFQTCFSQAPGFVAGFRG